MGYAVRMPQMGMTMQSGVVVEWGVEIGDDIDTGDVVCVVESEKTTNEVYARESGVLVDRFVTTEQAVAPGTPIAFVGAPNEDIPSEIREEAAAEADAATSGGATDTSADANVAAAGSTPPMTSEAKVSPRARRFAVEHEIPADRLPTIAGSGPDGAVIERDVVEAIETGVIEPDSSTGPGDTSGRDIYEEREGSRLRQTIATRMTTSAREAPQVTLTRWIPVSLTLEIRERLSADRGLEVSVTDFLVAAVCEALAAHPALNAIYEDGRHKLARNRNIGLAVDIEDGLVTPVIRGAGRLDLAAISRERERLVELARSREYAAEDLAGGTFTITNLGPYDIEFFDPLLNPPQIGILGVGALDDEQLPLSLTFDHRAVDGADAARFLDAVADALAHPLALVDRGEKGDGDPTVRPLETPATGQRTARAHSGSGLQAAVRSRGFEWPVDEPEHRGGDDSGPTPVEGFLGSLAACLTLSIRSVADRREVPVQDIDVIADAEPTDGRIEHIGLVVELATPADAETVDRLVETAERVCFVNDLIDDDIERTLTVEIRDM